MELLNGLPRTPNAGPIYQPYFYQPYPYFGGYPSYSFNPAYSFPHPLRLGGYSPPRAGGYGGWWGW
jgi:hypothetical protein